MIDLLKKSILDTLAYMRVHSYALTEDELFRYLWQPPAGTDRTAYREELLGLIDEGRVQTHTCLYALADDDISIDARQHAVAELEKKMNIARRAIQKLRWVPYLKAVFLCNTIASHTVQSSSDIDVFIVAQKNRLWIVRFFTVLTAALFRFRITSKERANKMCLSFYTTEAHLNMQDLQCGDPDIYLVYWLGQLMPVYDPSDMLSRIQQQNVWATKHVPRLYEPYQMSTTYRANIGGFRWLGRVFETLWQGSYGDLIQAQTKRIQLPFIEKNFRAQLATTETDVVVSDTVLKFHSNDRRAAYAEQWQGYRSQESS